MSWMPLSRFAIVTVGLISLAQPAEAQTAPSTPSSNNMGMYANPYTNPYANPFLNPFMTQMPANGNAALYFFAAQQANGGIGSGRLSGVRPAPAAPEPAASSDDRRLTDIPGGSASRYFNRGPKSPTRVNHYYNQSMRHQSSNRK